MQNLTLTGWSPFRCMCLWYKKQSKYSVQIFFFFVTLKRKYMLTLPRSLKTRVPKTKSNLLQSPPIYTDSVASRNESFRFILCTFRISSDNWNTQQTPSGASLLTFNNYLPQCNVGLSLAGPQGVLTNHLLSFSPLHTLTLTQTYRNTHTYIHKAQWIELWSNTSMNTPNC